MTLAEVPKETKAKIVAVLDSEVELKLVEFGLLPGSEFEVINRAPLGGPIYIRIGQNAISLRKREAKTITVEYIV